MSYLAQLKCDAAKYHKFYDLVVIESTYPNSLRGNVLLDIVRPLEEETLPYHQLSTVSKVCCIGRIHFRIILLTKYSL